MKKVSPSKRANLKTIVVCASLLFNLQYSLFYTPAAAAQRSPLGDSATASLITCGPGNDFYLAFGHSAIRISDPSCGIDFVFNYGTFDFDTPHFYLKFLRGKLNYRLSRLPYSLFLKTYAYERRAVWEQRLNLSPQEVNNLYLALTWNNLPENRYYRYDFFRDNCATRVRDMVEAAFAHRTIQYPPLHADHSYRRHVHESVGPCQQWWMLGVDLLLGLPADHRCDTREAMFHPMLMMDCFANSTVHGKDSTVSMIAQPAEQRLSDQREPLHRSFSPQVVFWLLLAAVALLSWKQLWPRWADRVLFIIAGLVGLFLCFMWFGTDHWCTSWNLNILWASPLLLLIALRLDHSPRWALWFQRACFLTALVWVLVCRLSPALVPLILTLALRVIRLIPRKPRQRPLPR